MPRFRIRRLDTLFARYADEPSLLDALHALVILESASPAPAVPDAKPVPSPGRPRVSPSPFTPTLTELVLSHLRSARGRARLQPPLTVAELFERRLSLYASAQVRSAAALRSAARFFVRAFGPDTPVADLSPARVRAALDARFRVPSSWNSLFRRLRLAVNWAVRARLLDVSPLAGLAPLRVDWKEPAFFLPDRVLRIFRAAEAHPGPLEAGVGAFLSLGFFAGVRTVEIARARWEDLDLDGAVLRIPLPKGFTRGRRPRLVELEPAAVAWLRRWRDWTRLHAGAAAGPLVPSPRLVCDWKRRRLAPAGDSWGNDAAHNAPRHTYATMHVAAFRNASATALNLGHGRDVALLERHYRGLVARSVALSFWSILPSSDPLPPPEPPPGRGFRSDLHPASAVPASRARGR